MHSKARILFLGTPKIAADVLEYLILEGYNVIGAVSQLDKEVDRKGRILPTEVKKVALKYNIPLYQFDKIRLHVDEVKNIAPDVILTLAYGQIVSQDILDIPPLKCINLHGSLLPKYRGAAPMQRVLLNGETKTGFTLMEMVKQMDAGAMFYKEEIEISNDDNYTTLYEKMTECAKKCVQNSLDKYLNGELIGVPQDENEVTFADKILKEDEKLNVNEDINGFINRVRCLSYTPGGYLMLDDIKLKIFRCHKINDNSSDEVGKILIAKKSNFVVALKDGELCIDELQIPGKKILKTADFLNGYHDQLVGKHLKNEQ